MADSASGAPGLLGSAFASPWYMRTDDNLRITSYNATATVTLNVRYRLLELDNSIQANQETQIPNTDRSAKASILVTPEGWLLGGEVFVSGAAPLEGQCYVVVEIVRGLAASALALQVIAAGYVTAKQPLPFPGVQIGSSLDGGGALRSITGATPAAGAEISETVPTGARWELITFRAQLATSATVANRAHRLTLDDGATEYYRAPNPAVTAASNTNQLAWLQGALNVAPNDGTVLLGVIPSNIRLAAGHRIRTVTGAIQAGDQYSAIQYLVREWIEGA